MMGRFEARCPNCGTLLTWETAKRFVMCPKCDMSIEVNYIEWGDEK